MKRTAPLRANPATTAAFQQRGRAKGLTRGDKPLQRGAGLASVPGLGGTDGPRVPLKRGKALRRTPPARGSRPATTPDVRLEVLCRDGGLCVWSRYLGEHRRAAHVHHLLPKGTGGWPQFAAVRANLVALAADLHWQHEFSPNDRLPWAALPGECQAFLRMVAAEDARAARFVRTKYPGAEI